MAEVFWPRTTSAVRGFSTSFGSRFARIRRPRAVFARRAFSTMAHAPRRMDT